VALAEARRVERAAQADRRLVVGARQPARVPTSTPSTSSADRISPSVYRNPTANSASRPGVRIVIVTLTDPGGAAGADRERLLPGEPVVADLHAIAPHRRDADAGRAALEGRLACGGDHLVDSAPAPGRSR